MTPLGLIHGVDHARELMEHPLLSAYVSEAVTEHIIPTLPYPEDEMHTRSFSLP
ncbi:hypothetical protein RB620_29775 [Paenibacillus sp. LHD-117]|uniref:hypothetical protein n=1 Tax=Paenibacillus sp. LHD-117 TaxID=3071412 RepID=UPI0027E0093B|nr:hypothetical protein [Paenibacillus sp. LHD-117]MDQ6423606.1 hypothetical protein [Paenibacillus sp. LHD-117]